MRPVQASLKSESCSIPHITLLNLVKKLLFLKIEVKKIEKNIFLEVIKSPKNEQDL